MDTFNTVFIFTDKAYLTWSGLGGIVFGVISLIALIIWAVYAFYMIVFQRNLKRVTHLLLAILLIFSAKKLIQLGYEEMQYYRNEYSRLQALHDTKSDEIAEGIVHVIQVGSQYGHDAGDIIQIDNVEFAVSCYQILQFTYSNAAHCGGSLTEGVYARVYYYMNDTEYSQLKQYPEILEVDIKK